MSLPAKMPILKTGEESLTRGGVETGCRLIDFWQWYASDLLSNAMRGCFAEFLVGTALGINMREPRTEWDSWDLVTPTGVKIEVKSASFLQTWHQKKLSDITFSIKPAKAWDVRTGKYAEIAKRQADIYVFCLLKHTDKETVDPLSLEQWAFYALPTCTLESVLPANKSISLNTLRDLTGEVAYDRLKEHVSECLITITGK